MKKLASVTLAALFFVAGATVMVAQNQNNPDLESQHPKDGPNGTAKQAPDQTPKHKKRTKKKDDPHSSDHGSTAEPKTN